MALNSGGKGGSPRSEPAAQEKDNAPRPRFGRGHGALKFPPFVVQLPESRGSEPAARFGVIALVGHRDSETERCLDDIAYSVMWDHDFRPIISLKVFSESHFMTALQKGFSFYRHVMREEVAV